MNRLGGTKAAAVLNVLHPQVDYWGLGQPAPQWRQRQVKVVSDMLYCVGESNGNYLALVLDLSDLTRVPVKLAL